MILVYTESENGHFKKTAQEALSYGYALASEMQMPVTALAIGPAENTDALMGFGAKQLLHLTQENLATFNAARYAAAIANVAQQHNATVLIFSSSASSKYIAPIVASKLKAGFVPNVVALPTNTQNFSVKHAVFSNKAFANTQINSEVKILGIAKNAFGLHPVDSQTEVLENSIAELPESTVTTTHTDRTTDTVTIADAEIVVSGGRGLKGPENWNMIEDLAQVLGAATACSKPVSDMGWRPHSEHVGQTGKPVAANLYIAIGISGAIQHLAGVNASKVKVVINNDPEAPFFKAADYGIVGDAFEIVPDLIEKLKAFKAQNA